jgi:Tfp pilus assembly protein PilO
MNRRQSRTTKIDEVIMSVALPQEPRLARQMDTFAKAQYVLAAAMLVVVGLFYVGVFRPQSFELQQLADQIAGKRAELDQDRSQTDRLPRITSELQSLKERLADFKKLPADPQLGQFIDEITRVSQQQSLRELVVEPGVPRRDDLFSEQPISMSFQGEFMAVWDFIQHLEDMQRLTRVRDVTITTDDDHPGVRVNLSINMYYGEAG